MNKPRIKKIYKKAFDKWGLDAQLGMLIEECAELIKATNKVLRQHKLTNTCWENFVEEIADVEIMIDQMKTIITWQCLQEKVEKVKHDKLIKLEKFNL